MFEKKKYDKAIAKLKKQNVVFLMGTVVNGDPLVVRDVTGSYYYVENVSNVLPGFPAWIYVKKTGDMTNLSIGGSTYTCVNCKRVEGPSSEALDNAQKRLESAKNTRSKCKVKLKNLEKSLKTTFKVIDKKLSLEVGTEYNMERTITIKGDVKYYNSISWTSSDKSVAKINSSGKLSVLDEGTVTIKAKLSVSGKTASVKLNCYVKKEENESETDDDDDDYGYDDEDDTTDDIDVEKFVMPGLYVIDNDDNEFAAGLFLNRKDEQHCDAALVIIDEDEEIWF